jgi:phosphate transport system protein
MQGETRKRFHDELAALEREIATEGSLAEAALARSMDALIHKNAVLADQVIADDDQIDATYLDVERRVIDLLAMQTPVAGDLRLVSAIMHINMHLERVGDMAVNIAKITRATLNLPTDQTVLSHIQEMGDVSGGMVRTAVEAFTRRDLQLCLALPRMDDPVDELNRGMYLEVVRLASDPRLLEWGVQMHMVARQLERVGDNAVDIGEQVSYLLTGEFREFTDASHPDQR